MITRNQSSLTSPEFQTRVFHRLLRSKVGFCFVCVLALCSVGFSQDGASEAEVAYQAGMEAVRQHSYEVALSKFKHAVELDPSDPLYLSQLGLTYSILENYPAAENSLAYAAKLDPKSVATWRSLAVVYHVQNKNREALNALVEAIGLDTTDGTTWARLGSLYLGLRRYGDAERAFNNWQVAEPKRFEPFYWKSEAQFSAGETDAAVISLQKALEVDSNFDYAYFLIGSHAQSTEAETALKEYTRRRPECADGWQALGRIHQSEGKWNDAYTELKRALDVRKANVLNSLLDMNALAIVCDHLRRKRESEYWTKAANDLIRLSPESLKMPPVVEPACSSSIDEIW